MLTSSFRTLALGGRIAAASALLATSAIAQTTVIETPQNTVVVPDDALETNPSEGFVLESDYPRLESFENNVAIAETLIAQGYSDVVISRDGPIMTITANRGGMPMELVYSTANGRLVSVDGVETRPAPEGSSAENASEPAASSNTSDMSTDADADADDASGDNVSDDSADSDGSSSGGTAGGATGDAASGSGDSEASGGAEGDGTAGSGEGSDNGGSAGEGSDAGGADSGSDSGGSDGSGSDGEGDSNG